MAEYSKEQLAPYAPLVGDSVTYHKDCGCTLTGKVTAVDGNIVDVDYGDGRNPADSGFIWRFHDGLNYLHDWPAKDKRFEVEMTPGAREATNEARREAGHRH